MFPAFPVHAQPAISRIWQEVHAHIITCLGDIHTGISVGDCHVAYFKHSSWVNDPKGVISPPRMYAALMIPCWISIAIHRPGWYTSMIRTTLVGWLIQGKVVVWTRRFRKSQINALKPCYLVMIYAFHMYVYVNVYIIQIYISYIYNTWIISAWGLKDNWTI